MKKIIVCFLTVLLGFSIAFAQETNTQNPKAKRTPKEVIIKDEGLGHKLNFGISFAPTFDWMYPATTGFANDGVIIGMRYGFNINVNLTQRKSFYLSTGLFSEHLGGKMKFVDYIAVPIPVGSYTVNATDISRTYRVNYLTIPIGITLKSKSLRNFFILGNAGIYNSLRLKATNSDTYAFTNWQTGEPEYWTKSATPSNEVAMIKESAYAGLGVEYSVTRNMRTGLTVNYVHSLTNYFKGKGKAQNNFTHEDQIARLGYLEIVLNINFF